jgi:hypothetical protein
MKDQESPKQDWRVILTLVVSALGSLFFAVQAFALGVFWLISLLDPARSVSEVAPLGVLFWNSILGGLLLIPILLLSIYQLRKKPVPDWLNLDNPTLAKASRWVILIWPVVVLLGWLVANSESAAMLFLGPINLLVAGIPILWIFQAVQRGLSGGSQLRKWRIFGFSIAILPTIVILVELLAFVFLGGLGLIWLGFRIYADPLIEQQIIQLTDQMIMHTEDIDAMIGVIKPFLLQPSIIFWVLAIFGGIIPIIEEVLKPLALWPLAGCRITPQEGFVGGLLCGAGFALMENVFYFTNVLLAEDWLFMAIGRAGTGVLHMLASGLLGWGLAKAWRKGGWAFLGLATLGAFILHGLWNILAFVSGLAPLLILDAEPSLGQLLLSHIPVILLMTVSIAGLFLINKHLRKGVPSAVESDPEGNI